MVVFPFFCPSCQKMADATADPVSLLFGVSDGQIELTCEDCETTFKANLKHNIQGPSLEIGEKVDESGD
jgi:hypothetical protein